MVNKISVSEFRYNKSHETGFFLLDVRSEQAYRNGHIAGAVSMPLVELGCKINELNRNKTIVVYSQNSNDLMATHAALLLEYSGFHNIIILEGGFDEWKANKTRVNTQKFPPSKESDAFLQGNIPSYDS